VLTRKYKVFYLQTQQTVRNAETGDLAIVWNGESTTTYYFNGRWIMDNGVRVGSGRRLINFPDEHWRKWVLHGSGEAIQWAYQDTLRKQNRKPTTIKPTTIFGTEMNTNQDTEFDGVQRNEARTVHAASSPASPGNTGAEQLILEILTHFYRIFSKSPETFTKCAGPLQSLLRTNITTIPVIDPGDAKKDGLLPDALITMMDLYNDLMNNEHDGIELVIEDCYRDSDTGDILTSAHLLVAMTTDSTGLESGRTPIVLGAINVPAHPAGSEDIEIRLPKYLIDSGLISPVLNGFPDLTSVLTSPGYLTEPHVDFCGVKQFIFHGGGKKLWLVWPPTSANLKAAFRYICSRSKSRDFTVAKALEELTGLEIRYCTEPGEYLSLEPFAIHAVICVTSSAHKNKLYVDYGSFDKWVEGFSLYVETLVSIHRAHGNDKPEREKLIGELINSRKSFKHWKALLAKNNKHSSAGNTKVQLREVENTLEDTLKSLGYSVKRPRPPSQNDSPKGKRPPKCAKRD
jgi:hypothetical protein